LTTIKRRIEITLFERERVAFRLLTIRCPVCLAESEMLTPEQAGDLARVEVRSIHEWLAEGKAHGLRTAGGEDRVCKNSLFQNREGS
jgi:hypothetical protein